MTLRNDSTQDIHYWSVSGNRNWTEAETQCVTEGGHLVEIFNGDTQNITVSLIATELYYLQGWGWLTDLRPRLRLDLLIRLTG